MSTENEVLTNIVNPLSEAVKKTITDFLSKGTLVPEKEAYHSWKIDEFEYTPEGVKRCLRHPELMIKDSWWKSSIAISDSIKLSRAYRSALDWLSSFMNGENDAIKAIDIVVSKLTNLHIPDQKVTGDALDELARNLLKDVLDEPVKNGARIALEGVVVFVDKVEFKIADTYIIFRRVEREDLELNTPVYSISLMPSGFLYTPTAILEIEFLGRKVRTIQTKVEQAITVLRLFKVGSVK